MSILFGLAAFALAVLLHGLVMRLPMQMDSVKRFLMVGMPLGLVLATAVWIRFGAGIDGIAAVLLYALLCELYLFCFTLVLSSVSATMLVMLRDEPIPAQALASVYDPAKMVQLRLGRLLKNGFVLGAKGNLAVTEKGMKYHDAFRRLRVFFAHDLT